MVIRFWAIPRALVDLTSGAEPNVEVRIAVIPSAATLSAVVDLTSVVVTNAEVRIEVIQNAATRNVVTLDATGDFPNAAVLVVVLSVVRDVARAVVLQSSATRFAAARCVQVAVFQCVADLDALVVLPDAAALQSAAAKVLLHGARAGVRVDRLSPAAVHAVQRAAGVAVAQAPEVFQFSVPAPVLTWLRVARSVALA